MQQLVDALRVAALVERKFAHRASPRAGHGGKRFIVLARGKLALIIRGYWIAMHARDRFGALMAAGLTTHLALQVFLNIGVVTNFLPATGISLPFFSYGGTALLIQLFEVGLILSISRQNDNKLL